MSVALAELIEAAEAVLTMLEKEWKNTGSDPVLMDLRDAIEAAKREL